MVLSEAFEIADPHALHERVLKAYEAQGFTRKLIGAWAISDNDAEDFVRLAIEANPKRILEVGTFVGVSTMLMALACPKARIFTVDPDFPLSVEMGAVNAGDAANEGERTQSIGRKAAEILGVSDRIEFVRGGFAIGDTFSSSLQTDGVRTEIVGPALCEREGPFDFIFVDGLHTVEAVAADLALASTALANHGVMILHDCIGFWGAQVRAGVFEFLRAHPEYEFQHPRYDELYRSVGIIRRKTSSARSAAPRREEPSATVMQTLLEVARTAIGAKPIVELTAYKSSEHQVDSLLSLANSDAIEGLIAAAIEQTAGGGFFSNDIADFADDKQLSSAFRAVAKSGLPLVLASTPPGEKGAAGPESRPLARIIELAENAGLFVYATPALDLEPARFPLLPEPRQLGLSSLFASVTVLSASKEFRDSKDRLYPRLVASLGAEREQMELQRVHIAVSFRRYLGAFFERGATIAKEIEMRTAEARDAERRISAYQAESRDAERRISAYQAEARDAERRISAYQAEARDAERRISAYQDGLEAQKKLADDMLSQLLGAYQMASVVDREIERQTALIETIQKQIT